MTKVSPATRAAAFERTPMVTRTASQTMPAKVANSLGWKEVCASASSAPPMPAIRGGQRPAITFICTTLMPDVRAPASLQRAAFSASPVVDRRKLTMNSAMITKTPRQR